MKIKILYVVYSLNIGGLERVVVDLANALDPQRYEPYICCIAEAGDFADEFRYRGNLFVIGNRGRINFRSCWRLYTIMRERNIDIVHSHNLAGLLYSFPGAKLRRIPLIHTNHGYLDEELGNEKLLRMENWISRYVDRYVCVSGRLKHDVEGRLRSKWDTISVLYNGIDVTDSDAAREPGKKESVLIGSVGSLSPVKNYRLLLESFSEIAGHYPDSRLELLGDGSERDGLVSLCDKLGIRDKVLFRGRVRDPLGYVKDFDIFVLTSLSEGLSMSILEAMGLGKICIVSEVGGNPEIITHGTNGFMFESNDRRDCAEKISYAIENLDSDEMAMVRTAAGNTAREKFSINAMRMGYCRLYDDSVA